MPPSLACIGLGRRQWIPIPIPLFLLWPLLGVGYVLAGVGIAVTRNHGSLASTSPSVGSRLGAGRSRPSAGGSRLGMGGSRLGAGRTIEASDARPSPIPDSGSSPATNGSDDVPAGSQRWTVPDGSARARPSLPWPQAVWMALEVYRQLPGLRVDVRSHDGTTVMVRVY